MKNEELSSAEWHSSFLILHLKKLQLVFPGFFQRCKLHPLLFVAFTQCLIFACQFFYKSIMRCRIQQAGRQREHSAMHLSYKLPARDRPELSSVPYEALKSWAPPIITGICTPARSSSRTTCTISSNEGVINPLNPTMSTFSRIAVSTIFSAGTITPRSMIS